jgi:hypothetical protein
MTTITKAVSPGGNNYIKTRTIGDATVTVIEFDEQTRDNGTVYWASATYEVKAGKKTVTMFTENGRFRVPTAPELKNPTIRQAIDAALGRKRGTLAEPVRNRRAAAEATVSTPQVPAQPAPVPDDLEARLRASVGQAAKPSTRRSRSAK